MRNAQIRGRYLARAAGIALATLATLGGCAAPVEGTEVDSPEHVDTEKAALAGPSITIGYVGSYFGFGAGQTVSMSYDFVATAPTAQPQNMFVNLLDKSGNIVASANYVPPTPTTKWSGDVRFSEPLTLPSNLPGGPYNLDAGLYNPTTGVRMPLAVGFNVTADTNTRYRVGGIVADPPIAIDSVGTLKGTAGHAVPITYQFTAANAPTAKPMKMFVHFLDANGNVVFQNDNFPPTPTTQWSGTISYTLQVTLPSTLANGSYTIDAGLYDPTLLVRMPLTAGPQVVVDTDTRYRIGSLCVNCTTVASPITQTPTLPYYWTGFPAAPASYLWPDFQLTPNTIYESPTCYYVAYDPVTYYEVDGPISGGTWASVVSRLYQYELQLLATYPHITMEVGCADGVKYSQSTLLCPGSESAADCQRFWGFYY